MMPPAVKIVDGAILLAVRLTPKGGRDAVDGLIQTPGGTALKARVSAPPEDGRANDALERLVAKWLRLPQRSVTLVAGGKSRNKTLRITGDAAALAGVLATLNALASS